MSDWDRERYGRRSNVWGGRGDDGLGADDDSVSRYDRSRYGSRAARGDADESPEQQRLQRRARQESGADALREPYYDSFFEDMRIDGEKPMRSRSSYARLADRDGRPRDTAEDVRSRTSRTRLAADAADGDEAPAGRGGGRRKALVALCVAAVLVLVGVGAAFGYMNSISSNLHEGVDQELRDALVQTDMAKEPFYMLLLGTDGSAERDNDPELAGVYRSDSMMLARVDAPNKKVTLVSINRDIIVDLGGEYGKQKINAAYGIGGPALAVKAVSKLAGVDISHYAQVDFDAFSALVDALGGVEVEVPIDIDDWEAGGAVSAGLQTLNGQEALILCRSRNAYAYTAAHPDEMRAANQRLVISAIAKKLLSSDIATIASSVQALSRYATTDLGITDIIGLAQAMQGLDPETDIYTAMTPTTSEYVDDTWIENLNKKAWTDMMERVDKGLPPTEETEIDEATGTVVATAGTSASSDSTPKYSTITLKNATTIQGLAARTRTKLLDAGFTTVVISDVAPGYEYPATLVVYNEPADEYEAEQIAQIIGQGTPFLNDGSYLLADTDYLVVIGDDWVE